MKTNIHRVFWSMIGLCLMLVFTGGAAYGQCGTRGHKPCVKSNKTAKKRVVRKKRVVKRKGSVRAASPRVVIPPRDPNKFTIMGSTNTEGSGSSSLGNNAPPPDYNAPAGNSPGVPKQISGGVLNGKAISLPKPAYPPAARAVRASGAVSVQVLIDENGNVISASAISGHALLRTAAVQAARGSKFPPTKLSGQPVKVSGIITYNFIP
jgi:TonB family protein